MNLSVRIKAIEGKIFIETEELPEGIFCQIIDARKGTSPDPLPVKGWRHGEQAIIRKPGESDSELFQRAFETVKDSMKYPAVPVFHPILEDGER